MVKFIIIIMLLVLVTALVLIDIFNVIKYRNEQLQTRISITEARKYCVESDCKTRKRIYELKRALNQQGISTDYISVERLEEPKEVRPIDGSYTSNN